MVYVINFECTSGPGTKGPQERTLEYLEEVAVQTARGIVNGTVKKTPKKKSLVDSK